jgi:hypothetical protein
MVWPIAFILNGSVFVLSGLGGVWVFASKGDAWSLYFCSAFALFGALFALGGAGAVAFRIKVDANGITRSAWYGLVVYRDSWEALRFWTIGRVKCPDRPDEFYVDFDFAGRRGPVRIGTSLVVNAGFGQFVEEVRSRAGAKEMPASTNVLL